MTYDEIKQIVNKNGFILEDLQNYSNSPTKYRSCHIRYESDIFSSVNADDVWCTVIFYPKSDEVRKIQFYPEIIDSNGYLSFSPELIDIDENVTLTKFNRKCISISKKIKEASIKRKIKDIDKDFV